MKYKDMIVSALYNVGNRSYDVQDARELTLDNL